jgi:stage II sporulation protein D
VRTTRTLATLGAAVVVGLAGPSAVTTLAQPAPTAPAPDWLSLRGHGFGHGHGLSQHGAQGGALRGRTYREILAHYYPGTEMDRVHGRIRVLITADTTSDVKVSPARGLTLRDRADGHTWLLPDGERIDRWRILRDGRVQARRPAGWSTWDIPGRSTLRGEGELFAAGPLTLWVPTAYGPEAVRYRGVLRAAQPEPGSPARDTVNVLRMDAYLRGVVASEMPAYWEQAALRSQAVAARTYAAYLRAQYRDRYYHTCDTTSCQVYGGVDDEQPTTDAAVRATSRQILRYAGAPAFTQFSASSGGYTASGGRPYLPARPDPWDDWPGNTVHDWTETVNTARLEQRYPRLGQLLGVQVTRRDGNGEWNGRVLRMRLDGSRDDVAISGDEFRAVYGLRSTWFVITDPA